MGQQRKLKRHKSTTEDKGPDLKKAAEIASAVAEQFRELTKLIDTRKVNKFQQNSLLELADELNNIKSHFESRTDGRPAPLDFSDQYTGLEKYTSEEDEEEIKSEYREWAYCTEPGPHNEKAFLGNLACSMDELVQIRQWIDDVISWHTENPARKKVISPLKNIG